jgi:hypothetical protein
MKNVCFHGFLAFILRGQKLLKFLLMANLKESNLHVCPSFNKVNINKKSTEMKYLNIKSAIIICLLSHNLTVVFAQTDAQNNCDTLMLKSGEMAVVKIEKIDNDFIAFYDCTAEKSSLSYIARKEVVGIKKKKKTSQNVKQPSTLVQKPQKLYIEGAVDLAISGISFVSLDKKSVTPIIFGTGATVSAGYQFNKWIGLGVMAKRNYALFDIPSLSVNSYLVNYRLDFDAVKYYFHYGYVSNISRVAGENCESFELDKTRPHAVFGISRKRYSKQAFVRGWSLFYAQTPFTESCRNNVSPIYKTFNKDWGVFEVKYSFGLYAPSRFRESAVQLR